MSDITVGSIPIINIVIFFIIYIVIHIIIGLQEKKYREVLGLPEKYKEAKELLKDPSLDFEKDVVDKYKTFSFLMRWFPAFYIIVILIILYGF